MLQFAVSVVLCMSVALTVSCGPAVVYEYTHSLPGVWTYADSASFTYDIADTTLGYDLSLEVQHTDAYPTQNLYAEFVTRYPGGGREAQPVSLELADKYGQWLGTCQGSDCLLTIPLQQAARYPSPGTYGLTLIQYGRQDSLVGLSGIGLRVVVSN